MEFGKPIGQRRKPIITLAQSDHRDHQIQSIESALLDGLLGQVHMGDCGRIE
jgi:hypothetical protein